MHSMEQSKVTVWFRILLLGALLSVGSVGFLTYLILDGEKGLRAIEVNIAASLDEAVHGRTIERVIETKIAEAELLDAQFVKEGDEVRFIEYIEESARRANVILDKQSVVVRDAMKPKNENEEKKYTALQKQKHLAVVVRAEGTWRDIQTFVAYMEYASIGVFVENAVFTFLPEEDGEEEGEVIPARWGVSLAMGALMHE